MADPLIVTLALDEAAQERFDALRRRHFPPERNHIGAHVTLFHALPGEERAAVEADLADLAAAHPPFPCRVTRVRALGRGVAFDVRAEPLDAVHRALAERWRARLTPQDAQPLSAHVTVQNKVEPAEARALLADLAASFSPYNVRAVGLALHRYAGGPWEPLGVHRFHG